MVLLLLLFSKTVMIGGIEGIIGPITESYVDRLIDRAEEEEVEALIIKIDTPGGLDQAMRNIVKRELQSEVPIIVYVYPSGARDTSAGVYITMAANIAAMSPGTNIGAASPVAFSPGMGGGEEQKVDETMKNKMMEDAAAYLRSIAKKRNRNVDWAERAVKQSISATAEEALELNVIDMVVSSIDSLIYRIDGKEVELPQEKKVIDTENAEKKHLPMNWREELLQLISNPNIAYILFVLGFYGLIFEITHPGAVIPGLLGALSLVLAFYSFQTLPVNYTGVALIVLGIGMFVMEVLTPTFGPLTIGGIVSMGIGSMMLINTNAEFLQISKPLIITAVGMTAAFFLFALGALIKAMRRTPTTGREGFKGEEGEVVRKVDPSGGKVFVRGEYWNAFADEEIAEGEKVEVLEVDRMKLKVRKKEV